MASTVRIATITSRIKGHHVFRHNYEAGEEFSCHLEPNNPHSPGGNAIAVKALQGVGNAEVVVGHVPEPLAQILGPFLKEGIIHSIKAKITGAERAAPEGVWVQGGGIELPCNYFVYAPKKYKSRIRNALRKKQ